MSEGAVHDRGVRTASPRATSLGFLEAEDRRAHDRVDVGPQVWCRSARIVSPYLAPMISWSFAVSTYCWNLVTLPALTSQTWQTCVSMLFLVALYVPV